MSTKRRSNLFHAVELLDRRPKRTTVLLSILIVLGIALINYYTFPDMTFVLFYLVPVTLVAWVVGFRPALLVAVVAISGWLASDLFGNVPFSHPFVPYWNAAMRFTYFYLFAYLFAYVRGSLERERQLSRTDSLTSALNRRAFEEVLESELERMRRYPHPISLAFIDLDNFKVVNDRYGHAVGDVVLVHVVSCLRAVTRKTDAIARLGGDEFVILMLETNSTVVRGAIDKLHRHLQKVMQINNWPVTASIGVITLVAPPMSAATLMQQVDSLMYRAKQEGKNKTVYAEYSEAARFIFQ
jgi:diguanylate cyclase (GGDEF)-like protein